MSRLLQAIWDKEGVVLRVEVVTLNTRSVTHPSVADKKTSRQRGS